MGMEHALTMAGTALSTFNSILTTVKTLRKEAKESQADAMWQQLEDVYERLLSLHEDIMNLRDINDQLRDKLKELEENAVEFKDGLYYRKKDGTGPYCITCYDKDGAHVLARVIADTDSYHNEHGFYSRCFSCNKPYPNHVNPT